MISPVFLLTVWTQTIPIALLMFLPFSEQDLRIRRRTGTLLSAGYLFAACIPLALISKWASVDGFRNELIRNAGLTVILAIYLIWWALQARGPAIRKLLVAGMMIHYAAILNALGSNLTSLALGGGERYLSHIHAEAGSFTYVLCTLAVTALTWPLVWQFCRRVLRETLPMLDDREARRGLGYICVMFVFFYYVSFILPYDLQPMASLVTAALVFTEMTAYYIFFQEIGSYLKRYGTVYDQLEKQRFSGDPVVDSVLKYYLTQAEEDGVSVERRVSLEGLTGVEAMDMTVLLGNCLENALEALRELPEENRRLSIEIVRSGAALLVRIRNSCVASGGGAFAGWEAFSSRKGKERRGLGLRSVAAIAEKYGGSAQFRYGDGEFTARVVLNTACSQP